MPADPIDDDRSAMLMMQEDFPGTNWQLHCGLPSKESVTRPCWECPCARAVECARENVDPILLVQVKKGRYRDQW